MENLTPVRSFLTDLIKPIVEDAVKAALPQTQPASGKRFLTLPEVYADYPISQSAIYRYFKSGKIDKYKSGGRTVVDRQDLEKLLKKETLAGTVELSRNGKKSK